MQIRQTCDIPLPAEELFALLHDYSKRPLWDPFTPKAEIVGGGPAGRGAIVRSVDKAGRSMDTVYVTYSPPLVATMKMVKGPWMISKLSGSWRIEPRGPSNCRLHATYLIAAGPQFFGWLTTRSVVNQFEKQTRARFASLVRYAERIAMRKTKS